MHEKHHLARQLTLAMLRLAILLVLLAVTMAFYLADYTSRQDRQHFADHIDQLAGQLSPQLANMDPQQQSERIEKILSRFFSDLKRDGYFYEITLGNRVLYRQGENIGSLQHQQAVGNSGLLLTGRLLSANWLKRLQGPLLVMLMMTGVAMVLLAVWARQYYRIVSADISQLMDTTRRLAATESAADDKLPVFNSREFTQLYESLRIVVRNLHTVAREDQAVNTLTGMLNEQRFNKNKQQIFELAERHLPMMLIVLDIDSLNLINQRFGNETGDEVIRGVADILNTSIRSTDQAYYMQNGRFHLVMLEMGEEDVLKWYEFMIRKFDELARTITQKHPRTVDITVSAAAALVSTADLTLDGTLIRCHEVLHTVKQRSKGIIVLARNPAPQAATVTGSQRQQDNQQREGEREANSHHYPWQ